MEVRFRVRGVEAFRAFLKTVPRGTVSTALAAIAEWLIGNGTRGLRQAPGYKYVPRARAYGQTFVSARQRRFVMAQIREGRMLPGYPRRTGNAQRGYMAQASNDGYRQTITNSDRGAYFTRSDKGQARLNLLAGWRKASNVISTNIKGALRHGQAAVNAWLRQHK
jgi:hypothetical protein